MVFLYEIQEKNNLYNFIVFATVIQAFILLPWLLLLLPKVTFFLGEYDGQLNFKGLMEKNRI